MWLRPQGSRDENYGSANSGHSLTKLIKNLKSAYAGKSILESCPKWIVAVLTPYFVGVKLTYKLQVSLVGFEAEFL
jgi:hypothetical protein